MTYSKIMADRMVIDYKGLVIALWDTAYKLSQGDEKALIRLELIKDDISRLSCAGDDLTNMKIYYDYQFNENQFENIIKLIEDKEHVEAINLLKKYNRHIDEAIQGKFLN